tara:strand:+ start:536 stop:2278 length:1743 start_codon:yes stop_codon:yes gene_type:complete
MKNNTFIVNLSKENSAKIFFSILFVYFFSLNIYQMHNQHWTAMLDQDIKIIYNSLLISSGFEQEYRDHPAYTTFLILGGVFKICSIFFDNFTIQEVFKSDNIDKEFQKLFYIGRIINTIYIFLLTLFIFKILNELKISKLISFISVSLSIFFISFYELLFVLRSEIVSVLMFLVSLYFLIRFLNKSNILYILLTGVFFALSMLAKIQAIFLFFSLFLALPFLITYLSATNRFNNLIKTSKLLPLCKIVLILFGIFYLLSQYLLSRNFLIELNDPAFSFLHNEDLFVFIFFSLFYFLFIKLLANYKFVSGNQIIVSVGMIISGFTLCIVIVLFLDILNIISFNKLNFLRLLNPIKFMGLHTFEMQKEVSIIMTFKALLQAAVGHYDLSAEFNEKFNPTVFNIDTKILFRNLHLLLLSLLILLSLISIKNKNLLNLTLAFLCGIIIYNLIFLLRETIGYNIFIFPLYIFIFSILLNKLSKRHLSIFSLIFVIVFLSENFFLSGMYKNIFSREPSVYNFCGLDKWKNSENYQENYNNRSYIKLVQDTDTWIKAYAKKFYEIGLEYCIQLDEKVNREQKFKFNY